MGTAAQTRRVQGVPDTNGGGARFPAEPPLVAVVDDDASIQRSLRSLLLSSGFRVETFPSAAAFLASAEAAATSCLVLDLSMPGMTGAELVAHLTATRRSVPFVVLTALADPEEKDRMMRSGAVAFLRKPTSGPELLRAIRSALNGARERASDGFPVK
jgi:FixJ family two-component response regulator